MIVWATKGSSLHRHYHRTPDCWRLRAGMGSRSRGLIMVNTDYPHQSLWTCKTCFGVERRDFFKPYCAVCQTFRACPHNGGILVKTDNGNMWVWPDRTAFHQPLREESQQV